MTADKDWSMLGCSVWEMCEVVHKQLFAVEVLSKTCKFVLMQACMQKYTACCLLFEDSLSFLFRSKASI